ncbi:MAG TPA: hypothetical protein VFE23_19250 [Usitatibacter sp.]|jgi:hypothetical protein|nr:hypothetical protein [Usitatibacter sp.]
MSPVPCLARRLWGALALLVAAFPAAAFWIGPPPMAYAPVREYVNDFTGHYVLLTDGAEINAVENGAAGPGWRYTGYNFTAYQLSETRDDAATALPVCRFYAPAPTNSHFYTADAAECDFLKTHDTGWVFEKTDFKVNVPSGGACSATQAPIWRAYNHRAAELDSNHRYGSDARVRAKMLQAGWVDEGLAFCAEGAGRDTQQGFYMMGSGNPPSADCGVASSDGRPCVAARNLPAMTARLDEYLPPRYYPANPDYTRDFADVTGWLAANSQDTIYAPAITPDHALDAQHSFVEDVGNGPIGMHVNGTDRTGGDYASISPTYPLIAQPTTLQPNTVIFPWAPPHADRDLWISTQLAVRTVRRADAQSQVYGHPLLDFRDVTTGHHLWVTLQAFGTNAPADFVGRDVQTGTTIVSTVFRASPLFGTRLAGDYLACTADTQGGSCPGDIDFSFRIDGDDFQKIVNLARGADPQLSANIAQYQVAAFQFHVEAYRDAEAGLVTDWLSLRLSY